MQCGGGALSVWQKSPDFRSLEVGICISETRHSKMYCLVRPQVGKAALIFVFAVQLLISFSEKLNFYFCSTRVEQLTAVSLRLDMLQMLFVVLAILTVIRPTTKHLRKKYELTKQRLSNIPNEVAITAMKGFFVIEKVRWSFPQEKKDWNFSVKGRSLVIWDWDTVLGFLAPWISREHACWVGREYMVDLRNHGRVGESSLNNIIWLQ